MERNLVENIKTAINDESVAVEICEPPPYISLFLIELGKIVLIYRKVPNTSLSKAQERDITESYINDCSSVFGQPLEAPFNPNDSFDLTKTLINFDGIENMEHGPLSLFDARTILGLCNLIIKPPFPVWILCDGSDGDRRTLLLSSHLADGWAKETWATLGAKESVDLLKDVVDTHQEISSLPRNQMQYDVVSTCELRKFCTPTNQVYSSTVLELRWKKPFLDPPLDSGTEATVITKCHIGKGSDGLLLLWEQLVLLQNYLDCVRNRPEGHIYGANFKLPDGSFLKDLQQAGGSGNSETSGVIKEQSNCFESKLKSIINEPIRGHRLNIEPKSSLEYCINCIAKVARPGLDLTDKLWFLLTECSMFHELSSAFQQVFRTAKETTVNKLFIRAENGSRLARALLGDSSAPPALLDPLESLIEIGIEKLKSELLLIFSKAQIATLYSLNVPRVPRFSEVAPGDWVESVERWLLWLSRAYCVLDLLSNTQSALAVTSNDSLLSFANSVLKEYVGHRSRVEGVGWLMENPVQEMNAAIPTKLIHVHLENEQWKFKCLNSVLTVASNSEYKKVKSVLYRGVNLPFPQLDNIILEDANETVVELQNCKSYQCVQLHSIAHNISEM